MSEPARAVLKEHLNVLKTLKHPPSLVKKTITAMCLLLGEDISEDDWASARKVLLDLQLPDRMAYLDPKDIPYKNLRAAEHCFMKFGIPYHEQVELLADCCSAACSLCAWAHSVIAAAPLPIQPYVPKQKAAVRPDTLRRSAVKRTPSRESPRQSVRQPGEKLPWSPPGKGPLRQRSQSAGQDRRKGRTAATDGETVESPSPRRAAPPQPSGERSSVAATPKTWVQASDSAYRASASNHLSRAPCQQGHSLVSPSGYQVPCAPDYRVPDAPPAYEVRDPRVYSLRNTAFYTGVDPRSLY